MSGHIFNIQDDGKLVEMNEAPFSNEDIFQSLLEQYPNLLAGDQINSAEPRRWLLICREMGVPAEKLGSDRWSLDHLFLDQDATPTLVEVKRSSDTRIRREVVGQMLDYAANAVVHWSIDQITNAYRNQCDNDGTDPVAGNFAGLPEGMDFIANGIGLSISYVGGDGNDVELTAGDQNTIYVDDNWLGMQRGTDPDGDGPARSFGFDSFATIQYAAAR